MLVLLIFLFFVCLLGIAIYYKHMVDCKHPQENTIKIEHKIVSTLQDIPSKNKLYVNKELLPSIDAYSSILDKPEYNDIDSLNKIYDSQVKDYLGWEKIPYMNKENLSVPGFNFKYVK